MSVDLSVVIPAFNEGHRLPDSLGKILGFLAERQEAHEVIVVDDGSEDGTAEAAAAFADRGVRLVRLPTNRGKGAALKAGVLASRGRWVLLSDADLSTPIEELTRLEALSDEAAVILGSRALPDSRIERRQPLHRQTMGKLFNLVLRALGLTRLRDTQCGFKLLRGDRARDLFARIETTGFAFDIELLRLAEEAGDRIAEVGVRWMHSDRSSVHPLWDSAAMLRDVLGLRLRELRRGRSPRPRR